MARIVIKGCGIEIDLLKGKSPLEIRETGIFSHLEENEADEAYEILLNELYKEVEKEESE